PIRFSSPPTIPLGSLILVTGVNGLIASHVADQLLFAGYRVRGSVRNAARASWLNPLFDSRHGPGRFDLVEVPDLAAPGAWAVALKDNVAGVASVAGSVNLHLADRDVDVEVQQELRAFFNLLDAAKAHPSVKSVAFNSSFWAAVTPEAGVHETVTEDTWNEKALRTTADQTLSAQEKGIAPFMAVKVKVERAVWDWVAREKPGFTLNAMLVDTVIGPILDPKNQAGSTVGML
ncbi:hypothetical protein B0T25DRAFT_415948, partial [Lasiosphaeria hispida]